MDELTRYVITFVAGAATPVVVEFGRSFVERKQRRQERRDDFQRETLLELQEAIYAHFRNMGAIFHFQSMAERQSGNWGKRLIPEDLDTKDGETKVRIHTLTVRVQDDDVRRLVREYLGKATEAVMAQSRPAAEDAFHATMNAHTPLNDRIGELLRSL